MIKLSIEKGVALAVVIMLLGIFGVLSLMRVPVQLTPDITPTSVTVSTRWPGATPQDIEKEIIIEQEKYLKSLPNLEEMQATANTGSAEIALEFATGTDLQEILVRVNNALTQVPSYPENVDQPSISTSNARDQAIAWFSLRAAPGNPKNLDIYAQQDFAEDWVQTEFERIAGVSQSEVLGGAERQVHVYVDPSKLAGRGITVSDLRNAIRTRNRDVSGGDFDEGKRRYLLRTVGRFNSMEDIENTVVAYREGAPVYVRDLGYAQMDRAETRAQVRYNGEPSLAMNVRRQPGSNIIQVMDAVKETVVELNEGILAERGLVLTQVSDDTLYIRESVALVRQNLILGAVLATLVLLLFLRSFTTTLIGALAIPICIVCSFLGLALFGRTINVISLAGIAFAIGMTLDNAIVVLENIYTHRIQGKGLFEAAFDGVTEVWGAVLASTLTTIFVFLPIVFVEEEAGQLFADIAIAIASAIFFSMVVSITVIPSASARLMTKVGETPKSSLGRGFQNLWGLTPVAVWINDWIVGSVRWLMGGVFRRMALVAIMATVSIGAAVLLMPKTEYLPDGKKNVLFAIMFPPPGYNVDEMTAIGEKIEAEYVPRVGADPDDWNPEEEPIPPLERFFFVTTPQQLFVVTMTQDSAHLDTLAPQLAGRLSQVPGMFAISQRIPLFGGGLGGTRGIELDISGPNLPEIFSVAETAFFQTFGFGRFSDGESWQTRPDPPSLSLGQPLLQIRPDWDRAAELGVDAADLGYAIWAFSDGAFMDEFFLADDKVDMYLYSTEGTVSRTQDLESLQLYTRDGGTIPLSAVAEVVPTVNSETIRRVDRQRTVTLTITPPPSVALEEAVEIIDRELVQGLKEQGVVPPDVTLRIAGASDKLADTREALGGNFLLAVIISYLLMVALFSHWGYPFVIMTSLPLGIVGGIVGLHLLNHMGDYFGWLGFENILTPLDVLTMLGFVVLVGTVVNNPILIVERTLQLTRAGMPVREAVTEAIANRVRPIFMSTTTTVFGLAPLVLIPGAGAELYRGLGAVVLFGLFFSTIFTLTFIPSLLSLVMEAADILKRGQQRLSSVIVPMAPQDEEKVQNDVVAKEDSPSQDWKPQPAER
ncbi:MAG: efflux RND transporter permease subunit [Sumerlaeia bacterium]